jgi:hypothetical protein
MAYLRAYVVTGGQMTPQHGDTQERLGRQLIGLDQLASGLREYWAYRWLLFVTNSPQGRACSFATAARYKQIPQQLKLRELVTNIRDHADTILGVLDQVAVDLAEEFPDETP